MEDYRKDNIIYDEDWLSVDTPLTQEYKHPEEEPDSQKKTDKDKNPKSHKRFPALITIQLVLCMLVAFVVFMLKAMDSQHYKELCEWYSSQMQETIVSDSTFEDIDLSHYFDTADESDLKATADEV